MRLHTPTHMHRHTEYNGSSLVWLLFFGLPSGLKEGTEWKQRKTTAHIMKTEDFASRSKVRTLRCMSASNYGGKGKRIKVPSPPGAPLVGLMLLVALPFGAGFKQSVPRVKLDHRGKIWTIIPFSTSLFMHIYIYFDFKKSLTKR